MKPIFDITFNIMMGLPGSGKTHYCKNQHDFNNYDVEYIYIDLDEHMKETSDVGEILWDEFNKKCLTEQRYYYENKKRDVYIDGLILNKDILKKIICACITYTNDSSYTSTVSFVIHMWDDDRKVCIHNDKYRVESGQRTESSEITIRNIVYESIFKRDIENIISSITEQTYPIHIINHEVYKVSSYNTILEPYKNDNHGKEFLVSNTWSGGGTAGSCWSDGLTTISADPIPEFTEFDDMLLNICPNISFLQYKKLYNSCVIVDEYQERDYYGGSETIYQYICDLKKLYNEMLDMNLIEK